ncbi:WD repeat-containing protein 93-like isoform X2 [Liolophura sinensis]|uniref:WD repeat-containing protein 93-like isoform X2 n=1 Tax=Liolophura sinensis TaxID=3198878 RepID=UPI003159678C
MPVYIRKNISYTPPSLKNFEGDDDNDDDFITDPEQIRDSLPQPYRMLDKVLGNILDDVWMTIAAREDERLAESNLLRPPCYECSVQLKTLAKATCLSNTEDGQFVFAGLPTGLAAIESSSQKVLATWEDDSVEIVQIKTSLLSTNMYLLSTIDDMGLARLFAYHAESFYLLKLLNEKDSTSSKIIASQCESSQAGDYVGVVLETSASGDLWLEVHRLPKDAWIKELESAVPKKPSNTQLDQPQSMQQVLVDNSPITVEISEDPDNPSNRSPGPNARTKSAKGTERNSMDTSPTKRRKSPKARNKSAKGLDRNSLGPTSTMNKKRSQLQADGIASAPSNLATAEGSIKFSQPTIVLKVKPPVDPQGIIIKTAPSVSLRKGSATPGLTLLQASKAADNPDVIGTGTQHLLSQQHLDQRQAMFEQCHEEVKCFMSRAQRCAGRRSAVTPQPTFHFLNAGRLMTTGIEQTGQADRCLSVCVWWAATSQLYHYALLKGGKDIEYKADIVWPFSCAITSTAVSPCTSLMAIGLDNGNIVIWDLCIGIQRGVMDISSSPVKQIHFLEPSICPQNTDGVVVFGKKTAFYLLVLCANSSVFLKRCGGALSEVSRPVQLTQSSEDGEAVTFLKPLTSLPRLVLQVLRNGSIYLQDVISGQLICQVTLPKSHDMATPWQPLIALGGGGKMMYVKGNPADTNPQCEDDTMPDTDKSVFVFQLRSFPTLDKFWQMENPEVPFVLPSTASTQVQVLMHTRMIQQVARKSRLVGRWSQYTKELAQIRDNRNKRLLVSAKSSFAESSIPRTPILVMRQNSQTGILSS